MNRTQLQLAILKVSLTAVGVLSLLLTVSILDTRPTSAASVVEGVVNKVVSRLPAAIPELLDPKSKPAKPRLDFEVWKIPCLGEARTANHVTDSRWVRVTAGTCDARAEIAGTKLENKTNGFVATVFTPTPSHLTSDFIPLDSGTNQLLVDLTLNSGRTYSYQWTVTRH